METSIILPVLLSTIFGLLETAHYFFLASTLENAVLHASRFGVIGNEGSGMTREEQVRAVIEEQTFGQIPISEMVIETLVYDSFSDIGSPEPYSDINENEVYDEGEPYTDINGNGVRDEDVGAVGLGGSGDIVLYRISHSPKSLTGFADWATRQLTLTAAVAVRNEPF